MMDDIDRKYPFTIKTQSQFPQPRDVDPKKYGHFRRVPTSEHTTWAFEDEAGRDLFRQNFYNDVLI